MTALEPPRPPGPVFTHGDLTGTTFEQVHDAHVRDVLTRLGERRLTAVEATALLTAMTVIAEEERYGEVVR